MNKIKPDQTNMTEYISCSKCHMKFINDDEHSKREFGHNTLSTRYKQCVKCITRQTTHR